MYFVRLANLAAVHCRDGAAGDPLDITANVAVHTREDDLRSFGFACVIGCLSARRLGRRSLPLKDRGEAGGDGGGQHPTCDR